MTSICSSSTGTACSSSENISCRKTSTWTLDTLEIFDNFYLWRDTDTGAEPPCVVDSNVERILHVFREPLSQRLREEGGHEASLEDGGGVMVHKRYDSHSLLLQ